MSELRQVLIFNSKQRLWSMAVCEMAPRPPSSIEGRNPSNANIAGPAIENRGKDASPLRVTFVEPAESAGGTSAAAGRRKEYRQVKNIFFGLDVHILRHARASIGGKQPSERSQEFPPKLRYIGRGVSLSAGCSPRGYLLTRSS